MMEFVNEVLAYIYSLSLDSINRYYNSNVHMDRFSLSSQSELELEKATFFKLHIFQAPLTLAPSAL